jgi:hypothetical protein
LRMAEIYAPALHCFTFHQSFRLIVDVALKSKCVAPGFADALARAWRHYPT